MRRIPDFLRPENKKPNPDSDKMKEMMEAYKEHFGEYPTTEPSVYGKKEWIKILKECIEKNISVYDLLEGELETGNLNDVDCIIITTSDSRHDA